MGRYIAAKNAIKRNFDRKIKAQKVLCEALEERQLMSLTIEVRGTDGSSSATVTSVGQVLNLELMAIVTDPNNTPTQDGLQDVTGNILSSAVQGHAVGGDLASATINPFKGFGAQPGTQQDLNGDGFLDVGSATTSSTAGSFIARSSVVQTSANGTIVGNSLEFEIATLTYTVRNLNKGGSTNINFAPYVSGVPDAASWLEDDGAQTGGFNTNNLDGVFQAGTPYVVSDAALIVPPVAVDDSATATRNTPLTINELANDDKVVGLNPASVTIVSNVAHGSTAVQSNGSVIYTPTTGYTGTDSFTYHVADTDGRVSNTATVNINVVLAPAPIAVAVSSTTLRNSPVTINVASQDTATAPATITPSSLAIVSPPTNGTAVVNSDGTVLYTPHSGFVGTDTFTYTVTDTNVETSNPGTVTITVATPTPPAAVNDSFTTTEGAPLSLNVLANDTKGSVAIDPTTVDVDTVPLHGTAVAQADGSILFTPAGGYIGSDSFTYSVADTLGEVSNTAVVNLTISHGVPPVASDFTVTALANQANTINVVANVISGATLTPSTLTTSTPTNGTATVNADGTVTYTPNSGFVGSDSFTYTVGNVNGDISNTSTANIFVGTTISQAKGAAHSVTYKDSAGGLETISLNRGTALVFFTGTGTLVLPANGKATVTGSSLDLQSIALSGTTAASSLSIKGVTKTPTTLGSLTSSTPIGSVNAPSVNLTGDVVLPNVTALTFGSVTNANFNLGSNTISTTYNFAGGSLTDAPSAIAGRLNLTLGAVTDSSIVSEIPIGTAKIASWTDSTPNGIAAPTITSLIVSGGFDADLALSKIGSAVVLNSAKIGGALDGSILTAATGSIGSIAATSVAGSWAGTVGALKSFTIKTGGLASNLTAGAIGTLAIGGDLTGAITATSATTIKVTGGISNNTLSFSGAAGVKTLSATGAISGETITSVGNVGTITAGSMSGSNIAVGVASGTTFTNSTAAALGNGVITSVKVIGKTPTYTTTNILAGRVTSASLGTVTADNGGVGFGIATKSINSFAGIFANGPFHAGAVQLKNDAVLSTYAQQQSAVFGDFTISIES